MSDRRSIEEAFRQVRRELGVRTSFPPEVLAEAEQGATRSQWRSQPEREELRDLPFVTIDPPGSRDLDQALYLERNGDGLRVRYAIADVAQFVDRGGSVEGEAWLRGVTYYSPDRRDPLYPPCLSQDAGSLLPDGDRPAVIFDLQLDRVGELVARRIFPGVIRSRAQLTYHQALEHVEGGGALFAADEFAESLGLLREVGELRLARERERGGVSLPILDQHVERSAARRLGYELGYETPNVAESLNAQLSLLAGHAAALRMAEGGVGLLRTMPPPQPGEVEKLRIAAGALGFEWPDGVSYASFLHSVDPAHPHLQVLVWQARRLMRGAGYVAFRECPAELPQHSAIALPYAHCTAPLRRLADRYVLDLLLRMERQEEPEEAEIATLERLPSVMEEAGRRSGQLERRVLDIAEAWELRGRVGESFTAIVLDHRGEELDTQLAEAPVRARVRAGSGEPVPALGEAVRVRLSQVALSEGRVEFEVIGTNG